MHLINKSNFKPDFNQCFEILRKNYTFYNKFVSYTYIVKIIINNYKYLNNMYQIYTE